MSISLAQFLTTKLQEIPLVSWGAVLLSIVILYTCFTSRPKRKFPLPPSPKGLPIIGHAHLMPAERPWLYFQQLGNRFVSPLLYLNLFGTDIVIINDINVANEILDKRSAKYSSRPRLVFCSDYVSSGRRMVLMPYSDEWRAHRSILHQNLMPKQSLSYRPIQAAESSVLMLNLLNTPEIFGKHYRRYSASVVSNISYGFRVDSEYGENAVAHVYNVVEQFSEMATPGAHLVDLFPVLDHLPDFLSPWRATALKMQAENHKVYGGLVEDVETKVKAGQMAPDACFAARLCNDKEKLHLHDLDIWYLAGTIFEAGTDTTSAVLNTFTLAMITHPAVFETAQAEVDRVCGDHVPTFEDYDRLPYIRAMCKETLRWRPAAAGGIPHMATTTEDDVFNGNCIPAGSTIVANHWAMALNTDTYENAVAFDPTRFLTSGNPLDLTKGHPGFGFGRRVCPGQHLAVQSIFIVVSRLCYFFDIKSLLGVEVDTFKYTNGLNIEPLPFECSITPRRGREDHIRREAELALETFRHL